MNHKKSIFLSLILAFVFSSSFAQVPNFNKILVLAAQGDINAQIKLGGMYGTGKGVQQNDAKALEWLSKAADQGSSMAQLLIGNIYYNGYGVEKNYIKAAEWYKKAADQGDENAELLLKSMFDNNEIPQSINSLAWSALPENNQISPSLKIQLSDIILTEREIMKGADQTQELYQYCIQDTVSKLKLMYPDADQAMVIDTVNDACVYSEDRFNLYNILLASSSMKKPISEKEAAIFIEQNYLKDGRNKTNANQREKIYKSLGLLK